MSSIVGIEGLSPTLEIIKHTKKIAIANKESIICGWNLIKKEIKKYKTNFVPVDSEHFSIWSLVKNIDKEKIDKVYITASGGPFLNWSKKKVSKAKAVTALKHPNWSMGKKISIDSASLMNKVFEVIEAQRIFNIDMNKFSILIHPNSYIHSIIKFYNGQIKILAHDPDMKIPIFNSIYQNNSKKIITKKINFNILNNMNISKVDTKKFKSLKILKRIKNKNTLFETVIVAANDELVDLYIKNKIRFLDIHQKLMNIINNKKYSSLISKKPKNISDIITLSEDVRLKTRNLCVKIKWYEANNKIIIINIFY